MSRGDRVLLILAPKLAPSLTIHGSSRWTPSAFYVKISRSTGLTIDDFIIHAKGLTSSEGAKLHGSRATAAGWPRGENQKAFAQCSLEALPRAVACVGGKGGADHFDITLDTFVKRIGRPINLLQMERAGLEVQC